MKIFLNNKAYCSYCFRELNDEQCSCGLKENDISFLKTGHIFDGFIITGAVCNNTDCCTEYYGFDSHTEKRLLIKEFYPPLLSERNPDGSLQIKYGCETKFKKAMDIYINRLQALNQQKENPCVFKVKYAFLQNNTSYFAVEYDSETRTDERTGESMIISGDAIFKSLYNSLILLRNIHKIGMVHGNISAHTVYISADSLIVDGFEPTGDEIGVLANESVKYEHSLEYLPLSNFGGSAAGQSSDVFSLGAVLYTVLTGKKPLSPFTEDIRFDFDELKKCCDNKDLYNLLCSMISENEPADTDRILKKNENIFKSRGFKLPDDLNYADQPSASEPSAKQTEPSRIGRTIIMAVCGILITVLLISVFLFIRKRNDDNQNITTNESSSASVSESSEATEFTGSKEKTSVSETGGKAKSSVFSGTDVPVEIRTKTEAENTTGKTTVSSSKAQVPTDFDENVIIGN